MNRLRISDCVCSGLLLTLFSFLYYNIITHGPWYGSAQHLAALLGLPFLVGTLAAWLWLGRQ